MRSFRDISIRRKLTLLIMITSSIGLLIAGAATIAFERMTFEQRITEDLSALARIIGAQSTAALAFNDPTTARENLAALKARPEIIAAGIYDKNGKLFAEFGRSRNEAATLPLQMTNVGQRLEADYLGLSQSIVQDEETVGFVYLRYDLRGMRSHLTRVFAIVAIVTVCLLIATLLLSGVLQRAISDPLLNLAAVAHVVSINKDYSVRATKSGNDEIGELIDTFNQMLTQIQERDEVLEQRVRERTEELSRANAELIVEIAERRQAQNEAQTAREAAESANRAKSEFLANMSHELRTPMNAIIGFSEVLEDKTFGDLNPKQERYVSNILTSGRHLLQLINDILDLVKVEAGRLDLNVSTLDVRQVVLDVTNIIQTLAGKKRISLRTVLPEEPLEVTADPAKFKQILYNLLSNAIKFTPEGGQVTVNASVVEDVGESSREHGPPLPIVKIAVSDTGIGIKPEDQQRIFERFEQVDSSYGRQQQGTGLGLALTRQLVELHGGRIWIESEGIEGKGSTFTFVLPLGAKTLESAGAPGQTTPNGPASPGRAYSYGAQNGRSDGRRPTVLVVEDNRQASDLLHHYLSEAGYEVTHAYDGQEAIRVAREIRPDAVTLDILLPREDGWHVLADLKSTPETAQIPVVIVSITEDQQLAFSLGAVDFLIKPVSKRQLIDALKKATAEQTGENKSVLLVDDDPHIIELLGGMLRPLGYRVLTALGGEEGIERAVKEKPQVIVLDLMMPRVTGFDVVNALYANGETRDIPIIVFSAKDITEEDRRRLSKSIHGIVSKSGKEVLLEELEKLQIGRA